MSVMEALSRQNALSFEVFPPKTEAGRQMLLGRGGVLEQLCRQSPDFLCCSCTGDAEFGKSLEIFDFVASPGKIPAMARLNLVGSTPQSIREQLELLGAHGVCLVSVGSENAGRMDRELSADAQLVSLIRKTFGDRFAVCVSGAPEGEPLGASLEEEIARLKALQDAGADFILSRLCWDMDVYRLWLEGIRAAGIALPVMAEVAPVTDQAATIRTAMASGGCAIARELCELLSDYWIYPSPLARDPFDGEAERKRESFRQAGIAYTARQMQDYRKLGVSGIHLLTGNRAQDVPEILQAAGLDTSL